MIVDTNVLLGAMLGTSIWRLERLTARGVLLLAPFHQLSETRVVLGYRLAQDTFVETKMQLLDAIVGEIGREVYLPYEKDARERIENPRSRDWPVLAAAMALDDEVWSNDRDFFGVGVPVWSTRNLDLRERSLQNG